jgi:PAS domain S-box-containing protein
MDNLVFNANNNELRQILSDIDFDTLKAFDLVPVITWISNPLAKCIFLNKIWYEFTGQTPETGLGTGWLDCIHPDDVKSYYSIFHLTEEPAPFHFEFRIKTRNGEYRWHLNSGQPQFDGLGNLKGYIGSCVDIHDQKKVEEDLLKSVNHHKLFA